MSEPKIGRVLASSLHQAITELVPTRVEFYESWLTPGRIRKGEMGRARVAGVLSFLRQEGESYDAVVRRAGRYTADWTVDTLPSVERAVVRRLPRPLRVRAVLRAARRLIRQLHAGSDLDSVVRRGTAVVEIEGSLFCDVRERAQAPLCGFYAALLDRYFEFFGLPGAAVVSRCRGTGEPSCELIIDTTVAPPPLTAGTTVEAGSAAPADPE
jgi:bacteriochlorophyll 4-vinyl reductase